MLGSESAVLGSEPAVLGSEPGVLGSEPAVPIGRGVAPRAQTPSSPAPRRLCCYVTSIRERGRQLQTPGGGLMQGHRQSVLRCE